MDCQGTTSENKNCSTCDGAGRIMYHGRYGEPELDECHHCYGSGKVQVSCSKAVTWIRRTGGGHPYCATCALLEVDFGKEDSYTQWVRIEDYKKETKDVF